MKKTKEVSELLQEIRIITFYLGEECPPLEDAGSVLCGNKHWVYFDGTLYLAHGKRCSNYVRYNGETLFLFECSSDYSQYKCGCTIPISQIKALLSEPLTRAKSSQKYRDVKYRTYLKFAREVALFFGKSRPSKYCEYGIVYLEYVYEDEKIIIETEESFDWDTRVYLKMNPGVQTVLDYHYFLEGNWTDYLGNLAAKARRAERRSQSGFIDDSFLFS
ncbi:hypothetical protein J6D24_00600 [Candidatus Saccharibacteria bacterium]|nr:hypothetical protein [Candidatus Saccharibacteria bacterium]